VIDTYIVRDGRPRDDKGRDDDGSSLLFGEAISFELRRPPS
jgi:hypothetical protein